jgi:hypothetical protein
MRERDLEHREAQPFDYAPYSEPLAIERLRARGIDTENLEYAFDIEHEEDAAKQEIPADIFWVRFKKPADAQATDCESVEGKLYIPKTNGNNELILFTPGFPGGNAGRFEQLYAKTFIDNGYTFFTVRHNGSSVSKLDTAQEIINNQKRLALAKQHDETHIGGTLPGGHSLAAIVKEPITPLLALQANSEVIHLMGQSMGVAASYQALTRMAEHYPAVAEKIQHVVGIAGYVGGVEGTEGEQWDGMKMPMRQASEYEMSYIKKVDTNTVQSPEEFSDEMRKVAALNEQIVVPEHVASVLVFTPDDPLIAGPDKSKEEAILNYGPKTNRKLIIRDESNLGAARPHSMLWIKPENLLRAVRSKLSGHGPHYIKVPNAGKGLLQKG